MTTLRLESHFSVCLQQVKLSKCVLCLKKIVVITCSFYVETFIYLVLVLCVMRKRLSVINVGTGCHEICAMSGPSRWGTRHLISDCGCLGCTLAHSHAPLPMLQYWLQGSGHTHGLCHTHLTPIIRVEMTGRN